MSTSGITPPVMDDQQTETEARVHDHAYLSGDLQANANTSKEPAIQDPRRLPGKTIDDLPQELLLNIVEWAVPVYDGRRETLLNLCLVKVFNPAATETLYGGKALDICPDFLWLRAILLNPSLGTLFRSLDLSLVCPDSHYDTGFERHDLTYLGFEDIKLFHSSVERLDISKPEHKDQWIESITDRGCCTALYALLLLHTPNITKLTLANEFCQWTNMEDHDHQSLGFWEVAILRIGMSFTRNAPQSFSSLRYVYLADAFYMIQLAPIMRLPAMERLEIAELVDGNQESGQHPPPCWSSDLFPPNSSRIRILGIQNGCIKEDALALLIGACEKLEYFCHGPFGIDPESPDPPIGLEKVGKALQKHKSTLRTLAFYAHPGYPNTYSTTIGSLVDFTRLERLGINSAALFPGQSDVAAEIQRLLPVSLDHQAPSTSASLLSLTSNISVSAETWIS